MSPDQPTEDLLRELAPQVLGALVRRHGQFDACEDAVQEALLAAALQWPADGVPDDPRAWLLTVASRRLVDLWRSESARTAGRSRPLRWRSSRSAVDTDDTLTLLFLCCHPSLSAPSQLALTLRAVGGLTTAEIAKAFLVPEATMAQRISRAKESIKAAGLRFDLPPEAERGERLQVVLHVLYLVFNEGYAATSGATAARTDLTAEAIRLTRLLHRLVPAAEVAGLLALMLLTDARRPARTDRGRVAGAAGRAGPQPLGRGADRRGHRADLGDARHRPGRAVPAAGGHRRGARRGTGRRPPPTGRRSWRCTTCSRGCRRVRW